jgi:hypothetical protein
MNPLRGSSEDVPLRRNCSSVAAHAPHRRSGFVTCSRRPAKIDSAVVTDRDTGHSRGFGFVEMATWKKLNEAIAQLNGKDLAAARCRRDARGVSEDRLMGTAAIRRRWRLGDSARGQGAELQRGERVRRRTREDQDIVGALEEFEGRDNHPRPRRAGEWRICRGEPDASGRGMRVLPRPISAVLPLVPFGALLTSGGFALLSRSRGRAFLTANRLPLP